GGDTEAKVSVVWTNFRRTIDGKERLETDTSNRMGKVKGVNRLEQHRRNIGL
ncbi:phage tail protein, partial [Escherichia coli]|uniref:phage major tail tube protein n=1 Tax=Escherichia coli TaxID=562 RepID=UPI00139B7AFC